MFEHGEMIYRDVMEEQDIIRCLDIIAGIPHAHPILCGAESAYLVESADGGKNGALLYYKRHAFVKNMEELKEMVHRDSIVKIAIYFDIDAAEKSSEVFSGIGKHLSAVAVSYTHLDVYKRQTYIANGTYVSLVAGYVSQLIPMSPLADQVLKIGMVLIFTVINLLGIKEVEKVLSLIHISWQE